MSWNDGYERKNFMARMKKQAEEYRAAGMTEEQIQAMYEFDLGVYKSDRNYYSHTQEYEASDFEEGVDDSDNALLNRYFREFSVSYDDRYFCESDRFGWIESIDNPELARELHQMTLLDKEILTRTVFEGFKLNELVKALNVPYRTLKYHYSGIREKISKIFS